MRVNAEIPLCIDLDGTLIKADSLIVSIRLLAFRRPWRLLQLPFWLMSGGKAGFKSGIASCVVPDAAKLPYDAAVLAWMRVEAERRPVILTTAAHFRIANAVAAHLGLFSEVVATDSVNLSGKGKARALVERFGERGFDYAGNAREDLTVWAHANSVIVVDAPADVLAAARLLGRVVRVFNCGVCEVIRMSEYG